MEVDLCLEQAQALPVPKNGLNLKTLCSKFLKHNHMEKNSVFPPPLQIPVDSHLITSQGGSPCVHWRSRSH